MKSSSKAAIAGAFVLAALSHGIPSPAALLASRSPAAAISFARSQIGCPYVWGGTGPCGSGYDCSGLVMDAWAAAGVTIPRTSQQQWAELPHAATPRRGYLVFFAGGDGTPSAPGHVGLVIGPHLMIEAYAPGYPVRIATFGLPGSPPGDGSPVGFADPGALS